MQKWILPSSTLLAMIVSFALFVFMANLINKPDTPPTVGSPYKPIIEFDMTKEKDVTIKDPKPIKPIEKTPPPPTRQNFIEPDSPKTAVTLDLIEAPALNPGSDGLTIGGGKSVNALNLIGNEHSDSDAMPITQVEPLYPIEAARKGVEGWVKLSFDIDKTGSVKNVQVIDSQPKRLFDKAAVKALKRWRYKAKFVGGAPVLQSGKMVQLDFTMDK